MIFETPLCELAYKYGTDKCPQISHSYTPIYYELLKDKRESTKKVLELGIGNAATMGRITYKYPQYKTGASLYMWRDFFPTAQIFGADFLGSTLINDDRVKTFFCDERKKTDLISLIQNTGSNIDLFVDDASHHGCNQVFACANLKPLMKKDVIYVIEDVSHPKRVAKDLRSYGYECEILFSNGSWLVSVTG
jgi:hypothetical protein